METNTTTRSFHRHDLQTVLPHVAQRVRAAEFASQDQIAEAFGIGKGTVTRWKHAAFRMGLKVITFEELQQEERNRQIAAAIIGGLAAGANAYSASRAGYYNQSSTVVTPRGGVYQVNTTGYSPTANAIAQSNAAAQNEAMIGSMIERGRENMAALEHGIIKDNTMMPGEWYGGQLVIQPLSSDAEGPKNYAISLLVGADRHQIDISQAASQ